MPLDQAAALAWVDAGCSVIPIKDDGSKAPRGPWKAAQAARAARDVVTGWLSGPGGLGVVCGAVSGHLEMLELEGRAVAEGYGEKLRQACRDNGVEDVLDVVMRGCRGKSPSGGYHFWYRVSDGPARGNTKLARRPGGAGVEVLIETRGEGGFAVVPPSNGTTHASGLPWVLDEGGPATIPTITAEQRDALHAVCTLLDEMPVEDQQPVTTTAPRLEGAAKRPGDDYNERASWDEILTPAGWTKLRRFGPGWAWRRPGKDGPGISATTGQSGDADRLYIFTTSTDLPSEQPLSKFWTYAQLQHGGDMRAATKALRAAGYGDPLPPREDIRSLIAPGQGPESEGNLATVHQLKPARLPAFTDAANAAIFVEQHADHLRYVPSRGAWLTWVGTHWAWCEDDGEAFQSATATVATFDTTTDKAFDHQVKSLGRRAIEAMVGLGRRHAELRVSADRLDADRYALNTPGGTIDLRTGSLGSHDRDALHTKITGCAPDSGAHPRRWLQFLAETFDGDQEMVAFIQRLAGYSACGVVTHHVLPFLHGSGGNGKSVFIDVMLALLGDYASTAPSGFLMASGRQDEAAIARLAGLRLVVASEVNQSSKFDEAKVKELTGGDRLTARFLYQGHFTFKPTHTLWLMGNHQPRVDAGGESFWRRLRLLPFTRIVPKEQRIEGLAEQLIAEEGPAILAWIVQGAVDMLEHGLAEPDAVMAATAAYAEEEDALARFVQDRCHLGGGHLVKIDTKDVRAAYERWCGEEGERPITPQVFGRELRSRFAIETKRSHGRRFYTGVTLLSDDDEPDSTNWTDR